MRKSFTQLISTMLLGMLVLLLTPYGLRAQDEAQTTLETFAEEASACYNESNSYEVEISVRDFQKIKELELYLAYDGDIFDFENFVLEASELSGILVTELPGDTLLFQWSSATPVDIANDPERAVIGKLQFSIDNYPFNTAFEYPTALTWDADKSEYLYAEGGTEQVLTGDFTDGSLTVTVAEDLQVITVTPDPAACFNSTVDVTVEPDGFLYSFNGEEFTDDNVANSTPGTNWVVVKDENDCISLRTEFTISAPAPVSFDYLVQDAECNGENGKIQFINVTGGTPSHTYIVVPEDEIDNVLYNWFYGNGTLINNFVFTTTQLLRPAGTYAIAVQDANNCVKLFDADDGFTEAWELITIDEPEPIGASAEVTEDISCYGEEDGVITVTMGYGGTPWPVDLYKVSLNGGIPVEVAQGASIVFEDLAGGTHTVAVMDMYCTQTLTVEIDEPFDAAFSLDYEDVACVDNPNGQIWIEEVWWLDPAGNDTLTDLTGWAFEVFGPGAVSEGTADVAGGIVDGLAPNYYSVFVTDPNGCVYAYSNPDGSGNRVPVMSPELIDFDVIQEDVVCKGSATGKITVTSLSGAVNYELSINGTDWQEELIFEDLTAGEYTVQVRDADNLEACVISQDVTIEEPAVALDVSVENIYAPTCDGGNDGNATAFAQGGWPFYDANDNPYYEYSLDGSPYWVGNPTFAVTEGSHILTVRDSMGCEFPVEFEVDDVKPIVIEVTTPETDPEIYCFDGSTNVLVSFISEANDFDDDEYTYKYSASSDMSGAQTLVLSGTEMTFLPAGTWYFTAEDPNGCVSAPYELEIEEGEELEVLEIVPEDATCFGYWDGSITIKMTGGSPFLTGDRYKYIIKNNYAALSNPDNEWLPFYNDDFENDSTLTVMLQKGTYFIAVKDSCDMIAEAFQIEGFDAIEIAEAEVGPVTCYGDDDGYIDLTGSVTGGNEAEGYLYSLSQVGEGTSLIVEDQESPVFDELVAGTYMVSVTDANGCPAATETYNVLSPAPLDVQFDSLYVSCNGAEDGEIFIDISGGTGGTYGLGGQETDDEYSTDGNKYRVVINNTDSEGISYGEYAFADDVDSKIFQVAAGEYEVIVYDANDCMYGPTIISIEEPEAWDVTTDFTFPSDCGEEDGSISVTVNDGGWVDLGMGYQFKLNDGEWSDVVNEGEYTFDNVGFGTHTIYVQNDTAAIEGAVDPAINETRCIYSETVVISEASPFDYDVEVTNVSCHGGDDGQFIITNVTGGQGTEGYQFQLVNSENPTVDETMWLPVDEEGDPVWVTEFTFDTLVYGHHTLYIRDDAGYTLSKCQAAESWHIRQPDSLEIVETMWINDVTCNGGSDGSFEIIADGGTPPYKYAYTESQVVSPEHPYQHMPDLDDETLWQTDPVFTGVPAGTFIAWVVDENGCWIGGEIRPNGQVVDNHRVVIAEPEMIVSADTVVTDATCYGEANGSIVLNSVTGGNGVPFTYEVTGTMYDGTDTTYVFDDAEYDGVTDELTGLYASMDDTSNYVGPEDMYFIYAIDAGGCRQLVDSTYITQPEEFVIDLVVDEDAFICANDLAGIVDIITVSGGTGDPVYQVYRDGVLVRNWTSNASHVVEAGHTYKVIAKDENDCTAEVEKYIESPEPITFDVIRTSCYGDEFASARIEVQGEADRQFRVIYVETENDIPVASDTTEWFTSEININTFVYDGENADDVHYEMIVEDNFGCKSEIGVFTFDPVQTQLTLTTEVDGNMITASAIGGKVNSSSDYEFAIETVDYTGSMDSMMWSNETMFTVDSFATWVVYVRDLNRCWTTDTIESIGFSTMTVAQVQGDGDVSPVENTIVGVTGTVTAVVEGEGFFMQDANGAGNGIWVEYATTGDVTIDAGVQVVGTVAEVESVTTILADEVTDAAAPVVVVADTLASPSAAIDEMYESVLVIVEGAWGTEANEEGQWEIYYETNDSVMVNDWIYAYTPTAGNVYHVTGVVNGKADAYMLEPRMESDIVDVTATTPVDPEIELVEFTVYPNPFDYSRNVQIKGNEDNKLTRVVVSNIAGQRVIDIEYPGQEIRGTRNLVSGVYVVSMFTEDGLVKTERMIKR